jgi:RNA polymerase sigma-70 factor (ECF subfamily)
VRRRGRRPAAIIDDQVDAIGDDAPGLDERVSDRLDLDAALTTLPAEFRAAVVLRDVVGMDYADIAASLEVPIGTVRSRIARGRRQLATRMGLGNQTASSSVSPEEP